MDKDFKAYLEAQGGRNHKSNLVLCHSKCNEQAGHMDLIDKIKLREGKRDTYREKVKVTFAGTEAEYLEFCKEEK